MSLVERLGFKTLNNLYDCLSVEEIEEWMAFDMLKNPEEFKKIKLSLEKETTYTKEEEALLVLKMFGKA